MDQNRQLLVCPVFAQTFNFERLFRDCLYLMGDLPLVKMSANSSHIWGRKGPETPLKGAISWMLHRHENI